MRIDVSSSVEFMTPLTMPKFQNRYGISGNYYSWGDKLENQSSYDLKTSFELGATFIIHLIFQSETIRSDLFFDCCCKF